MVIQVICSMGINPACMLFANHIDSLACAGAVLAEVWVDGVSMPVVDSLGDEFLEYVKDGMKITVKADGIVEVE
jgi:predicted aconitase with swiveling domain